MKPLVFQAGQSRAATWALRSVSFGALVALMAVGLAATSAISGLNALVLLTASVLFGVLALILVAVAGVSIWQKGKQGFGMLVAALLMSIALLAYPAYFVARGINLPVLNDVTTDIDHPPEYSTAAIAVAARAGHNPGPVSIDVRKAQQKAYPDVQPILVDIDSQQAFDLALQAIKVLGWKVIVAVPPGKHQTFGHIDATDRTRLLHFVDDITLRIGPNQGQTQIDIRSSSRVGKSDFGANAARIMRFSDEFQQLVDNL